MKKALVAKLALAGAVGLAAAMASGTANATDCNACHTMHNSQDGASMRFDAGTTPLPILLRGSCIYCHSGLNTTATIAVEPPKVIGTAAPTYSGLAGTSAAGGTLAGGDFWYVGNVGDFAGHNVNLVDAADATLGNTPPGGAALGAQLECAGTLGCHGDPAVLDPLGSLSGAHHAPHNDVTDVLDGLTVGTSFRYLLGTLGREDTDWQFSETAADHNRYNGLARTADTAAATTATISGMCAGCHGSYHNSAVGTDGFGINTNNADFTAAGAQWIRHPTDYEMSAVAGEYANFTTYQPETPVGRLAASLGVAGDDVNAGNRIVLCVSCHRAHGSPYADALRWSYGTMDVGTGVTNGCMNCHTAK